MNYKLGKKTYYYIIYNTVINTCWKYTLIFAFSSYVTARLATGLRISA